MKKSICTYQQINNYVSQFFDHEMHAKRVESIATAMFGCLKAGSIAISAIAKALGQFRGLKVKHALKQVDRLLSNTKFDLNATFPLWINFLLASKKEIVVALDWTDFSKDGQATLALHMVNKTGRSSPLLWKTVLQSELKNKQNDVEDELLSSFKEMLPEDISVTVLADRGFLDMAFFAFMRQLGFDFIVRCRKNVLIEHGGERQQANAWLSPSGRSQGLRGVKATKDGYCVPFFVSTRDKKMQEAWHLLSSRDDLRASQIVSLYGRRFTIEERFRDIKDDRFGMGLSRIRVSKPERRDRMLFLCALAIPLLSLLGAAGESLGMDRMLKCNTVKHRTHSLLTQGSHYFLCLSVMSGPELNKLLKRFNELLSEHAVFTGIFGVI